MLMVMDGWFFAVPRGRPEGGSPQRRKPEKRAVHGGRQDGARAGVWRGLRRLRTAVGKQKLLEAEPTQGA